jgi:hypothetical protein
MSDNSTEKTGVPPGTLLVQPDLPPASPASMKRASEALELIGRHGAMFAAFVYASGVLVVVLHQGKYGVWPLEILKPRAFAAGVLLTTTLAAGTFMGVHAFGLLRSKRWWHDEAHSVLSPWQAGLCGAVWLLWQCESASSWVSGLMFGYSDAARPDLTPLLIASFVSAVILLIVQFAKSLPAYIRVSAVGCIGLGLVAVLLKFYGPISAMTWWLFACGLTTVVVPHYWQRLREGDIQDMSPLTSLIVLLMFFAQSVYPQVRPIMGGGNPPVVTVLLGTDLPFAVKQKPLRMFLLDENERGLYLIRSKKSKQALWIPREAVASIIYQDELQSAGNTSRSSDAAGSPTSLVP